MGYTGFELHPDVIEMLEQTFPPSYPDRPDHPHITDKFGVSADHPLPDADELKIIGFADDSNGIQALVIEVDGQTHRADGKHYHLTWSFDRTKTAPSDFDISSDPSKRKEKTYRPMHSNGLIREQGFQEFEEPIVITDFESKHFDTSPQTPATAAPVQEKQKSVRIDHTPK